MAILTSAQLAEDRQDAVRRLPPPIEFDKPTINAALQAIEDLFEITGLGNMRGAVNSAMAPFIPTDEQRDAIIDAWLKQKGRRVG